MFRVVLVVEMDLSPSKMPEPSPESDGMSWIALLVSIQFRIIFMSLSCCLHCLVGYAVVSLCIGG